MNNPNNSSKLNPIIARFFDTVSWGDECQIKNVTPNWQVVKHNQTWFNPCSFESLPQIKKEIDKLLTLVEPIQGAKAALIIDGKINQADVEGIFWLSHQTKITPFFVEAEPAFYYNEMTNRALDGIDWERSLSSALENPNTAQPVFNWDKDKTNNSANVDRLALEKNFKQVQQKVLPQNTPLNEQLRRTEIIVPILKQFFKAQETNSFDGKKYAATWDKTNNIFTLNRKTDNQLLMVAQITEGEVKPAIIPLNDPSKPNLTEADVKHFTELAPKIEQKIALRRSSYRDQYQRLKSKCLSFEPSLSAEEVDAAIALSVLRDTKNLTEVERILTESDTARDWERYLPESEYSDLLSGYIDSLQSLAQQQLPKFRRRTDPDFELD